MGKRRFEMRLELSEQEVKKILYALHRTENQVKGAIEDYRYEPKHRHNREWAEKLEADLAKLVAVTNEIESQM